MPLSDGGALGNTGQSDNDKRQGGDASNMRESHPATGVENVNIPFYVFPSFLRRLVTCVINEATSRL
jgi:hypothetical protein